MTPCFCDFKGGLCMKRPITAPHMPPTMWDRWEILLAVNRPPRISCVRYSAATAIRVSGISPGLLPEVEARKISMYTTEDAPRSMDAPPKKMWNRPATSAVTANMNSSRQLP